MFIGVGLVIPAKGTWVLNLFFSSWSYSSSFSIKRGFSSILPFLSIGESISSGPESLPRLSGLSLRKIFSGLATVWNFDCPLVDPWSADWRTLSQGKSVIDYVGTSSLDLGSKPTCQSPELRNYSPVTCKLLNILLIAFFLPLSSDSRESGDARPPSSCLLTALSNLELGYIVSFFYNILYSLFRLAVERPSNRLFSTLAIRFVFSLCSCIYNVVLLSFGCIPEFIPSYVSGFCGFWSNSIGLGFGLIKLKLVCWPAALSTFIYFIFMPKFGVFMFEFCSYSETPCSVPKSFALGSLVSSIFSSMLMWAFVVSF